MINTDELTVNILVEHDGELFITAMDKDSFEAVSFLAKRAVTKLVKTGRTQEELLDFLNYKK